MPLVSLEISGFRNIKALKIECAAGLNVLIGANAAGKTSFLEAIYFLSRGRSFRTPRMRDMIHHSARSLQIVARVQGGVRSRPVVAGMAYNGIRSKVRLNGEPARSLAELTAQLPVLLLNPDSHRLLDDGPQHRRRFLDWGVFHAEARFLQVWRRYQAALRQRNAALRTDPSQRALQAWEGELVAAAEQLDTLRHAFCQALAVELVPVLHTVLGVHTVALDYQRGWPAERSLAAVLQDDAVTDRRHGHTRRGPHRADFSVRLDGEPAAICLSRGQQKLLIIALMLAQARLYQAQHDHPCIMLIDDLPAELDSDNRQRVLSYLGEQPLQLFITTISETALALDWNVWPQVRRFQMTHGDIQEVVQ